MNSLRLPFFTEINRAENVLIAGAGGEFDVFSGLPLAFNLHAAGKQVFLANLTFSNLPRILCLDGMRDLSAYAEVQRHIDLFHLHQQGRLRKRRDIPV